MIYLVEDLVYDHLLFDIMLRGVYMLLILRNIIPTYKFETQPVQYGVIECDIATNTSTLHIYPLSHLEMKLKRKHIHDATID